MDDEKKAKAMHDVWSHWMKYQFSMCHKNSDGDTVIPKELVERWERQANTEYGNLTEKEKQSDRDVATKFLALEEVINIPQEIRNRLQDKHNATDLGDEQLTYAYEMAKAFLPSYSSEEKIMEGAVIYARELLGKVRMKFITPEGQEFFEVVVAVRKEWQSRARGY